MELGARNRKADLFFTYFVAQRKFVDKSCTARTVRAVGLSSDNERAYVCSLAGIFFVYLNLLCIVFTLNEDRANLCSVP